MAVKKVCIDAAGFSPSEVACNVGGCVKFQNDDDKVHSVDFDPVDGAPPVVSGDLSPGATFTTPPFSAAGTFHYHCSHSPDHTGTVEVS